jgi:hypothetical protein
MKQGEDSAPARSAVRRRVATSIKFEDGPEKALTAVEFEAPPTPSVLNMICSTLAAKKVAIIDSATRITPRALFQRFQLSELDGSNLVGERRREIEMVFIEALAAA